MALRYLIKKSNYKPFQIVFSAVSPGGTSRVSDEDYPSAVHASSMVNASGIGQYTAPQLKKYLSAIFRKFTPHSISLKRDSEELQIALV